jgi:PKHD-type hydroxylase
MSLNLHLDKLCFFANQVEYFTKQECEKIIEIGNKEKKFSALIGDEINSTIVDENIRKNKISWLSLNEETKFIYEKLYQIINHYNDNYFKFDLHGIFEQLQFTEYEAPDNFYDYHIDNRINHPTRKLSISIQLSDPNDYEGGELILNNGEELVMPKNQGTLVAFPSFVLHKAKPVTKGIRYSLVVWVAGPTFK